MQLGPDDFLKFDLAELRFGVFFCLFILNYYYFLFGTSGVVSNWSFSSQSVLL